MTIKNHIYHFTSDWNINATPALAELAIHNVPEWKLWWRDLVYVNIVRETPSYIGSEFEAAWRSAVGYTLHMSIVITSFEAGKSIGFDATGDLQGSGTWQFTSAQHGTTAMHITWNVATTKPWMNTLAPLLKPLFTLNHHILMRRAETSLNKYLPERTAE